MRNCLFRMIVNKILFCMPENKYNIRRNWSVLLQLWSIQKEANRRSPNSNLDSNLVGKNRKRTGREGDGETGR